MVASCCAYNCKEREIKGTPYTFHKFPSNERRRTQWRILLRRENFVVSNSTRICSKHFEDHCFDAARLGTSGRTWLKPEAVPTLFDFTDHSLQNENVRKSARSSNSSSDGRKRPKKKLFWRAFEENDAVTPSIAGEILQLTEEEQQADGQVDNSATSTGARKHYLGDFDEEDMKCPDKALQMLTTAKETVRSKTKSIKILKQACRRYEDQIAILVEKLRRANKRLGRPKKKKRSEETSFNHDVSANLELELTTADSIPDQEVAIKEEPMWETEESGTSGYQDVYPGLSSTDPTSRPGVSSTSVTPSVVSVTSLAKPPPHPSGEILGLPVGEVPALSDLPPSQGVSLDSSGEMINGVLEKKPVIASSGEAAGGEEAKVLPEYRTRDQFDVYGEYIASKLRRLDWRTCAHVQKAFGDIIFQAELGKFTVPGVGYPTP